MASEDVIELGSSDDETEPVPKKKKPALNVMVHFPNTVPGLMIKPIKPVLPPLQKVLAGGAVTITNVKSGKVPIRVYKGKVNNRPVQKLSPKIPHGMPMLRPVSNLRNNFSINPLSFMSNQQNIRVHAPKLHLPPDITIKRTAVDQAILGDSRVNRKRHISKRKQPQRTITTVELDDEVAPVTFGASPQWYLRPEEQVEQPASVIEEDGKVEVEISIEEANNKEPDKSNFIEITIEDSPVKPVLKPRTHEIGAELAITIEDSPVKVAKEQPHVFSSDDEVQSSIVPQSKKKLEYVRDEEGMRVAEIQNTVKMDIEKTVCSEENRETEPHKKSISMEKGRKEETEVIMSKKIKTAQITKEVKEVDMQNEPVYANDSSEFNPVYQRFIDLCFKLENSDDMQKIVEKKIKTYYRQCPKEYVESEEFTDMVSGKIFAMKASPDKMYLYIKDIVDELNLQRKTAKAMEASNKDIKDTGNEKYLCIENAEYDSKRGRQIRKLEKTIKKLHRAIQKLEEQEVEFDDEEDSVYLLTERYKERLIRVHAKFCQLTKTKLPSEPHIHIEARPGQPAGPAKRLEKWVNRKVPIGAPLPFPDFHDVLRCVREANVEDRLFWNEAEIMEEARDLFIRCGKKLQRRRQENEWRIAASRISHNVSTLDPAETSVALKSRLEENKNIADKKETDLFNKYADKQNQLKLVAEEIGDKEAEESPAESEEDEMNDDSNSLEDRKKRKERIKRLLHEKTRKMSTEKENFSTNHQGSKDKEVKVETEKGYVKNSNENDSNKKESIQGLIDESDNKMIDIDTESITANKHSNDLNTEKSNDIDTHSIDSDIDELHLLQKLYSENEINSSTLESDSDTPIAISDTLDSDSEPDKIRKQNYDIISIENSSYSESEITKDECFKKQDSLYVKEKIKDEGELLRNAEIELSSSNSKVDEIDENILLASSDEDKYISDTHSNTDNMVGTKNTRLTEVSIAVNKNIEDIDPVAHDNCETSFEVNNEITDEIHSQNKNEGDQTNSTMANKFDNSEKNNTLRNESDFKACDGINAGTLQEKVEVNLQTLDTNNDMAYDMIIAECNVNTNNKLSHTYTSQENFENYESNDPIKSLQDNNLLHKTNHSPSFNTKISTEINKTETKVVSMGMGEITIQIENSSYNENNCTTNITDNELGVINDSSDNKP